MVDISYLSLNRLVTKTTSAIPLSISFGRQHRSQKLRSAYPILSHPSLEWTLDIQSLYYKLNPMDWILSDFHSALLRLARNILLQIFGGGWGTPSSPPPPNSVSIEQTFQRPIKNVDFPRLKWSVMWSWISCLLQISALLISGFNQTLDFTMLLHQAQEESPQLSRALKLPRLGWGWQSLRLTLCNGSTILSSLLACSKRLSIWWSANRWEKSHVHLQTCKYQANNN